MQPFPSSRRRHARFPESPFPLFCIIASSIALLHCSAGPGDDGSTGGAGTGGGASGGVGVGGAASGGVAGGGTTSGGAASGGSVSGGGPASGGAASGGQSSVGGTATGGDMSTGGAASGGGPDTGGGASDGGAASGGEPSTGGAGTGGSGGSEPIVCPSPALTAGNTTKMVSVGGMNRSYILHVPATYDGTQPAPLVVDFHPLGGSGQAESSGSPYPAQTDPDGVVMAFPSGLSGPSGNAWDVGPCCVKGPDDVAFARALVEQVQTEACIDPKRIYAVGFSMGGGMTHYLGCHAADVFAAIAPAAFDLLEENVTTCEPTRPLTVVAFRGTSDPIVPYGGGYSAVVSGMPITFLGAQGTMEKWAEFDGCTGSAEDSGNGCKTYSQCDAGTTVTLCSKQGGGHEAGNASLAWPILKQHTLP